MDRSKLAWTRKFTKRLLKLSQRKIKYHFIVDYIQRRKISSVITMLDWNKKGNKLHWRNATFAPSLLEISAVSRPPAMTFIAFLCTCFGEFTGNINFKVFAAITGLSLSVVLFLSDLITLCNDPTFIVVHKYFQVLLDWPMLNIITFYGNLTISM